MNGVVAVVLQLLVEAANRRWFLALLACITLALLVLGSSLRLDVVDGALAATTFFGRPLDNDIQAVDVALRPVFRAAALVLYFGGLGFGIFVCVDFAPSLLAPGRIEFMLSLPIRRWQLLVGTYLGVILLSLGAAAYGSAGLVLLLGVKTGHWAVEPLLAGLAGGLSFAAVYGCMLCSTLVVRSAALSGGIGWMVYVVGLIAGNREELAGLFEPGVTRALFELATLPIPRFSTIGMRLGDLAGSALGDPGQLLRLLLAQLLFGLAALGIAIWLFERKDF